MLKEGIKQIDELTPDERETMYVIMQNHYDNIRRDVFFGDLDEKDGTLLVYDDTGIIQGFSTFLFMETSHLDEKITILFSGDTIVSRKYWGNLSQLKIFVKLLEHALSKYRTRIFWLLITKGYRTYLILPLFFKNYYPNYKSPTPEYEKALIEKVAFHRYGKQTIAHGDITRLATNKDFLKKEFVEIPEKRLNDPDVRFFLDKNPSYKTGEELVCIAEISRNNFSKAYGMLKK